ncbi:hypothetical protein XELAEV_18010010mg [Xenopus laevis]|uniref:Uncharacterized protein n=1 Tax=Xenopus laevis TaxID=8355 RepID=A0A974DV36_XENLA|nr:hypothetical protein XELAEV_18010010mg [Xenopus laevis]
MDTMADFPFKISLVVFRNKHCACIFTFQSNFTLRYNVHSLHFLVSMFQLLQIFITVICNLSEKHLCLLS